MRISLIIVMPLGRVDRAVDSSRSLRERNARAYAFDEIFTIEARNNIFLETMTEHLKLRAEQVFDEIWRLAHDLREGLARKDVQYADLKNALVPQTSKHERAYVFDYMRVGDNWYGKRIVETLLPTLDPRSTNSFLCGDWLTSDRNDDWYLQDLWKRLVRKPREGGGIRPTLAIYYVNNLTRSAAENLEKAASTVPGYLGCLELDFACPTKFAISNMLVRAFIKHKKYIVSPCPEEDFPVDDVDMLGYSFEELGFELKSVPGLHYGILLSYKIERPTSEDLEQDSRFSLNALTPAILPLSSLEVSVEPAKLEYLRNSKAGSLSRARIEGISDTALASKIKQRVLDNYIYSLGRSESGETLKFNVILEFERKAKIQCALEYRPSQKSLRLITLF